jgi:hypothetical protein
MVRVRRVVVPILVLAASLSLTAASRPPADLHQIGDHWTAYYPPDPATFPAGSKVHVIKQGDTLWDLASTFYGNAYLWPQLWESNTYIRDAHWIYPGDPLLVQGEATVVPTDTTAVSVDDGFPTTDDEAALVTTTVADGPPIALGTEADLYCFGYLGALDEPMPNWIASFEDVEVKYTTGALVQDTGVATNDIIFISGGTASGIVAGETYLVVRPAEVISLPGSKEVIGRHYDFRGQVRILCATETYATAIVTQACSDILIGDRLKPLPQLPIPLSRQTAMRAVCDQTSGKAKGYIVNAKDGKYTLGVGSLVEVNLGANNMIEPGDFLTVYRPNVVAGMPDLVLGEIGVLTANTNTATGRIVRMRYFMTVGDRVEIK